MWAHSTEHISTLENHENLEISEITVEETKETWQLYAMWSEKDFRGKNDEIWIKSIF